MEFIIPIATQLDFSLRQIDAISTETSVVEVWSKIRNYEIPTIHGATTCHLTNSAPIGAIRTIWCRNGMLVDMREPEQFEILENYAVFSLSGHVSVERAVDLVTTAIEFARARHIRNLLVDASDLTGFELPSVTKRYFFVHEWARASAGFVRVALVTRPETLDPRRFGRIVAANICFITDAFTTEEDALSWLQGVK